MTRSGKPNILIFMTDQQQEQVTRTDHPCRTPHLDRFSTAGVRFNWAFTTMTHCCPSRASFMTGLYPSEHGVHNNVCNESALSRGLNEGVATFGERLAEGGYELYFSGKWHVSAEENPADRGWRELLVTADKHAYMSTSRAQWKQKPTDAGEGVRERGCVRRPGWGQFRLYGVSDSLYNNDLEVVRQAALQIEELKEGANPWCMYVGLFAPHDPFLVPEKYAAMYDPDLVELPPNYRDDLAGKPGYYRRMRKLWDQLDEREVKESIAHYWGFCTMVDDLFGETLQALERSGQADDTLVVFMSDHGESLGAHGLYLKGVSPFDETYRIPCVIRWPNGIINPGREIDELVSMTDFAPTFLEVAGCGGDLRMSGRSLLPFLADRQPDGWRDAVYAQCSGVEIYYTQRIVRTRDYKYVYNPLDVDELYDLRRDPWEMVNQADNRTYEAVKKELLQKMWRFAEETGDTRIFNDYPTVAHAAYGPAAGIGLPGSGI